MQNCLKSPFGVRKAKTVHTPVVKKKIGMISCLDILIRTPDGSAKASIEQNFRKGRGALYALMGAGCHGLNGLHPKVSLKLWNVYVMPRLTFGLEVFRYSPAEVERLEVFQRQSLRKIQHLPEGTCNAIVLLMLGQPPVVV